MAPGTGLHVMVIPFDVAFDEEIGIFEPRALDLFGNLRFHGRGPLRIPALARKLQIGVQAVVNHSREFLIEDLVRL